MGNRIIFGSTTAPRHACQSFEAEQRRASNSQIARDKSRTAKSRLRVPTTPSENFAQRMSFEFTANARWSIVTVWLRFLTA